RSAFVKAFRGAPGAFLMTPVVAPPENYEFDLGRDLADAAVEAGVDPIVFSTLDNVDAITAGSKFAPPFTAQARFDAYI
ncbi:NmrA family NAD(P)-binding protein, partial [Rhizobium ruizarguesonis]